MQPEPTTNGDTRTYRVEVGHNSVIVQSTSVEGAIGAARTLLSLQLPRLWDVIQKLTPDKFSVSMIY
jgi:hypothetical protein